MLAGDFRGLCFLCRSRAHVAGRAGNYDEGLRSALSKTVEPPRPIPTDCLQRDDGLLEFAGRKLSLPRFGPLPTGNRELR